jgi:hypothetical protein
MCQHHRSQGAPLRTVIKETVRTFFTHTWDVRSNTVNNRDVRLLDPQCV